MQNVRYYVQILSNKDKVSSPSVNADEKRFLKGTSLFLQKALQTNFVILRGPFRLVLERA